METSSEFYESVRPSCFTRAALDKRTPRLQDPDDLGLHEDHDPR